MSKEIVFFEAFAFAVTNPNNGFAENQGIGRKRLIELSDKLAKVGIAAIVPASAQSDGSFYSDTLYLFVSGTKKTTKVTDALTALELVAELNPSEHGVVTAESVGLNNFSSYNGGTILRFWWD